jgi:REP element-mobilizing transposase RayT
MYLAQAEVAGLVVGAIEYHADGLGHYDLHAYVVMSNHVHLLVTPRAEVSKMTQSLKRFTARQANRILSRTGLPFWQDESYDHVVRDGEEFRRIKRYIELNPVRAGLVAAPDEFPWSSARPIDNRPQVTNLPHISSH